MAMKYQVQVDVLSNTLFALLLPKLREAAALPSLNDYRPHLSFLNSIALYEIPNKALPPERQLLIERADDEAKRDPVEQYFDIKLATWYAVKGVAELCEKDGSGVVINSTCSGLCKQI
ncbi:hypothetical protein GQ53DRAFT_842898 [Thozetella sp. PMI_491]|nr:hypothetical protein GQ53DRAFT_842898 [Thozetella sp. PMI_491]